MYRLINNNLRRPIEESLADIRIPSIGWENVLIGLKMGGR
jgi:hypothetical protein